MNGNGPRNQGQIPKLDPQVLLPNIVSIMRENHTPAEIILFPSHKCSSSTRIGLPAYSIFCMEVVKLLREKFLLLVYTLPALKHC